MQFVGVDRSDRIECELPAESCELPGHLLSPEAIEKADIARSSGKFGGVGVDLPRVGVDNRGPFVAIVARKKMGRHSER